MIELQGSEKQIQWATTIRQTTVQMAQEWSEKRVDKVLAARVADHVLNQFPQAAWWIENRRIAGPSLCNEMARHYETTIEKRAKKQAEKAVAAYEEGK